MKYTAKQRQAIIKWWSDSYGIFRFMKDGSVEAKRTAQNAWGLLYTAEQMQAHLKVAGLL
jgi:hypothetical protein